MVVKGGQRAKTYGRWRDRPDTSIDAACPATLHFDRRELFSRLSPTNARPSTRGDEIELADQAQQNELIACIVAAAAALQASQKFVYRQLFDGHASSLETVRTAALVLAVHLCALSSTTPGEPGVLCGHMDALSAPHPTAEPQRTPPRSRAPTLPSRVACPPPAYTRRRRGRRCLSDGRDVGASPRCVRRTCTDGPSADALQMPLHWAAHCDTRGWLQSLHRSSGRWLHNKMARCGEAARTTSSCSARVRAS
ncbi:hypothetical protein PsYK624_100650 [Phanerochaete sordida]|uniref:Uncharacterized protein n=1 Tax=Phanerochaete sordida TaxID=48140 RepID=A0A9P3GHR4_9APHY|nr:hypothetical protein PsYK624_100650 [Phanerochaete sordida]